MGIIGSVRIDSFENLNSTIYSIKAAAYDQRYKKTELH